MNSHKSALFEMVSDCPSVCLSTYISATATGRIKVQYDNGDFMKTCREIRNSVKIEQKMSGT